MSGMSFSEICFLFLVLPGLRTARAQVPVRANSPGTSRPIGTHWGWHSHEPNQTVSDAAILSYAYPGSTEWNRQYTPPFVPGGSQLLHTSITDNLEGHIAHHTLAQGMCRYRHATGVRGAHRRLAGVVPDDLARLPRRSWPRAWT